MEKSTPRTNALVAVILVTKWVSLFVLFLWVCYDLFIVGAKTGNTGDVRLAFLASSLLWSMVFIVTMQVLRTDGEVSSIPLLIHMSPADKMWTILSVGAGLVVNTLVLHLVCWAAWIPFPVVF